VRCAGTKAIFDDARNRRQALLHNRRRAAFVPRGRQAAELRTCNQLGLAVSRDCSAAVSHVASTARAAGKTGTARCRSDRRFAGGCSVLEADFDKLRVCRDGKRNRGKTRIRLPASQRRRHRHTEAVRVARSGESKVISSWSTTSGAKSTRREGRQFCDVAAVRSGIYWQNEAERKIAEAAATPSGKAAKLSSVTEIGAARVLSAGISPGHYPKIRSVCPNTAELRPDAGLQEIWATSSSGRPVPRLGSHCEAA